ncbi:MAG: 50S ribosomal protein L21 [Candidatus Omnitrophica bacterium]|nr:50S ribosomal protein L21 [Candidatus Omnitrophota bacterium]
MFAIIKTGGKQYKVKSGDELDVELLEVKKGSAIRFAEVLLLGKDGAIQVGRPFVKGAYCEAEVLREVKAPKVISFKYIRREKSATKRGHRQKYLRVRITSIHGS